MAKWLVSVSWETEVEAADEGMALIEADLFFDFMKDARAEKQDECEGCGSRDDLGVMDDDDVLLCKACRDSTSAGE